MSDPFNGRTVIESDEYLAYLASQNGPSLPQMGRKHKYGAVPVEIDGITFASTMEGNRYTILKRMEKNGEIKHLELQPRFALIVNNAHCGYYVADFSYDRDGKFVVEDVKGVQTPVYRLKKKLVKAIHGIEVVEVKG